MLPSASFGYDTGFAHALRQQRLSKRVIDFVGSPVREVFAFEVDFGAAQLFAEIFRIIERSGSADEFRLVVIQFPLECGVFFGFSISCFKLGYGFNQDFGNEAPAVLAEFAINWVTT